MYSYRSVQGWGRLIFADASPAAGRDFTDDGRVHEARGLKGRARQAAARRATRNVPIPPELVALLREHIERFGSGEDGRLFRSGNGNPIQPSTWWQVWRKVRLLALTPEQLATPLMRRPYDLRHSGITWRLNSGVPPTEIAAWAGHPRMRRLQPRRPGAAQITESDPSLGSHATGSPTRRVSQGPAPPPW